MTSGSEICANALNAASIVLAGRNSAHTWWVGIAGCLVYAMVFYEARLYADVTLQGFFVVTSAIGWWSWRTGRLGVERPVRRSSGRLVLAAFLGGLGVAAGYAWLLWRFTDAYAPLVDSTVLAFSVLGQLLLMARRLESWWCWLVVNTLAVPLFAARGLYLTALLYAGFWVNAWVALRHWRKLVVAV